MGSSWAFAEHLQSWAFEDGIVDCYTQSDFMQVSTSSEQGFSPALLQTTPLRIQLETPHSNSSQSVLEAASEMEELS